MVRWYLTVIGVFYIALAAWCSIAPVPTSKAVGFERVGGSGASEFLTVYGGLELALGLILLLPWVNPDSTRFALLACLIVHGCLVVFRTIGFFAFTGIDAITIRLAVGEWVILLAGVAVWLVSRPGRAG